MTLRYVFTPETVASRSSVKTTEGCVMDPHFNEYLAAVAGMHDLYGDLPCDTGTEFHAVAEELATAARLIAERAETVAAT